MLQGDDPPYLPVGTDVSAKYKGAFCEAKISKVVRVLQLKVTYNVPGLGSGTITDEHIKYPPGAAYIPLRVNQVIQVKHPEKKEYVNATINRLRDCSQYTVVFDDGDITTLRRTALCLKSGRHFNESETLDQLPLTHPEHFLNPVVGGSRRGRRSRHLNDNSDGDGDDLDDYSVSDRQSRDGSPGSGPNSNYSRAESLGKDIGKVVCIEATETKRNKAGKESSTWFPGLVVAPTAQAAVRINTREECLIRSFKDGRYYTVPRKEMQEFKRESRVESPTLAEAVDKALNYLDKAELPQHWDKDILFGLHSNDSDSDLNATDKSDDEESREEKDHFVAKLYKYMDDRGTPFTKEPTIGNRDLDLCRLFRVTQKLGGGYNGVTNRNKWRAVTIKLGLSKNPSITTMNLVKQAYFRYLYPFEDFNRKLGCTMLIPQMPTDSPSRSTTVVSRGAGRNLIRERDKIAASPKLSDDEEKPLKDVVKPETKQQATIVTAATSSTTVTSTTTAVAATTTTACDTTTIKEAKTVEKRKKIVTKKVNEVEEADSDSSSASIQRKETGPAKKNVKKPSGLLTTKKLKAAREQLKAKVKNLIVMKQLQNKVKTKKPQTNQQQQTRSKSFLLKKDNNNSIITTTTTTAAASPASSSVATTKTTKQLVRSSSVSSATSSLKNDNDDQKKIRGRKRKEIIESDCDKKLSDDNKPIIASRVCVGDKLKVYYGPNPESKVTYEAKVLEIEKDEESDDEKALRYFVHYTGWNNRYDEWIKPNRIAENISQSSKSKRMKTTTTSQGTGPQSPNKQLKNQNSSKRGRGSSISSNNRLNAGRLRQSSLESVKRNRQNDATLRKRQNSSESSRSVTPSVKPRPLSARIANKGAKPDEKSTARKKLRAQESSESESELDSSDSDDEMQSSDSSSSSSSEEDEDEGLLTRKQKQQKYQGANKEASNSAKEPSVTTTTTSNDESSTATLINERPKRSKKLTKKLSTPSESGGVSKNLQLTKAINTALCASNVTVQVSKIDEMEAVAAIAVQSRQNELKATNQSKINETKPIAINNQSKTIENKTTNNNQSKQIENKTINNNQSKELKNMSQSKVETKTSNSQSKISETKASNQSKVSEMKLSDKQTKISEVNEKQTKLSEVKINDKQMKVGEMKSIINQSTKVGGNIETKLLPNQIKTNENMKTNNNQTTKPNDIKIATKTNEMKTMFQTKTNECKINQIKTNEMKTINNQLKDTTKNNQSKLNEIKTTPTQLKANEIKVTMFSSQSAKPVQQKQDITAKLMQQTVAKLANYKNISAAISMQKVGNAKMFQSTTAASSMIKTPTVKKVTKSISSVKTTTTTTPAMKTVQKSEETLKCQSPQPKGRDFDLNQIRLELKGFDKAVKTTLENVTPDQTETKTVVKEMSHDNDVKSEIKLEPIDTSKIVTVKIEKTDDDIYEFKETEPFELDTRKKMSDDKTTAAKKRLGMPIFNLLQGEKKEKLVDKPSTATTLRVYSSAAETKKTRALKRQQNGGGSTTVLTKKLDEIEKVDDVKPGQKLIDDNKKVIAPFVVSQIDLKKDEKSESGGGDDSKKVEIKTNVLSLFSMSNFPGLTMFKKKIDDEDDETDPIINEAIQRVIAQTHEDSMEDVLLSTESFDNKNVKLDVVKKQLSETICKDLKVMVEKIDSCEKKLEVVSSPPPPTVVEVNKIEKKIETKGDGKIVKKEKSSGGGGGKQFEIKKANIDEVVNEIEILKTDVRSDEIDEKIDLTNISKIVQKSLNDKLKISEKKDLTITTVSSTTSSSTTVLPSSTNLTSTTILIRSLSNKQRSGSTTTTTKKPESIEKKTSDESSDSSVDDVKLEIDEKQKIDTKKELIANRLSNEKIKKDYTTFELGDISITKESIAAPPILDEETSSQNNDESDNIQLLLCEETIPGSPAPAPIEICQNVTMNEMVQKSIKKPNKTMMSEMPFASAPPGICTSSGTQTSISVTHRVCDTQNNKLVNKINENFTKALTSSALESSSSTIKSSLTKSELVCQSFVKIGSQQNSDTETDTSSNSASPSRDEITTSTLNVAKIESNNKKDDTHSNRQQKTPTSLNEAETSLNTENLPLDIRLKKSGGGVTTTTSRPSSSSSISTPIQTSLTANSNQTTTPTQNVYMPSNNGGTSSGGSFVSPNMSPAHSTNTGITNNNYTTTTTSNINRKRRRALIKGGNDMDITVTLSATTQLSTNYGATTTTVSKRGRKPNALRNSTNQLQRGRHSASSSPMHNILNSYNGSDSEDTSNMSEDTNLKPSPFAFNNSLSNILQSARNSLSTKFHLPELDTIVDPSQRIQIIQQKLNDLRKGYAEKKGELAAIEKRLKKIRRRDREGKRNKR